jgi:hypothetical protein
MNNPKTLKGNNNGLLLTLSLFFLIIAAGTASAIFWYNLGYESLKGITQPDFNPTKKIAPEQKNDGKNGTVAIVSEKEILTKVDKFIQAQTDNKKTPDSKSQSGTKQGVEGNQSFIKSPENQGKAGVQLPLKTSDEGMSLSIVGVSKEDEDLVIDIELTNQGSDSVQFLYSFLIIKNEEERLLSSVVEDLPREILPGKEKVSGKVKIPLSLLDDSRELSLTLNDYPEEKIQLTIPKISLEGLGGT